MIVDELNASRPVMYAGQASDGGHEFICDGYNSEGYFHFNWGWSGNSNGYFLLPRSTPGNRASAPLRVATTIARK
ncbi:MAG: C10 family peptidase [Muribaculaceae bacterium]|nr:C10 family peptidase [Muribaculaceae bacterium]